MTKQTEPRGESEWSRRAIINVLEVLAEHTDSLTLVGAHAVLLRTVDLDVPMAPTGDGDLGVTPNLVGDVPSIEELLTGAGYEHRTDARPGLWGRTAYVDGNGVRQFREKIDLLTGRELSGAVGRQRRGVPLLQGKHGRLTVGNARGLELSALDRSPMRIADFADPSLGVEANVAGIPALICAKAFKVGERLDKPRQGAVRDKDIGDLWRLMAATAIDETIDTFERYAADPVIGPSVRQGQTYLVAILSDGANLERAKRSFEGIVDPRRIDQVFDGWLAKLRAG